MVVYNDGFRADPIGESQEYLLGLPGDIPAHRPGVTFNLGQVPLNATININTIAHGVVAVSVDGLYGTIVNPTVGDGIYNVRLDKLGRNDVGAGYPNSMRLTIEEAPSADNFQAYFLGWDTRGGVVYMTLPGVGGSDYFFTAKLSGCSVMVSGNPDSPTVYHCGVGEKWPNGHPGPTGNVTSEMIWRALVEHVTPGGPYPKIDKADYRGDGTYAAGTLEADTLQTGLIAAKDPKAEVRDIGGVVFGRRVGGNWSFYLQEQATLSWRERKSTRGVAKLFKQYVYAKRTETAFRPVKVVKFFPLPRVNLDKTWDINNP